MSAGHKKQGRRSKVSKPDPKAQATVEKIHAAVAKAEGAGEPIYRVIRPFKYDGAYMAINKPWVPIGFPNDDKIISCGRFVMLIDSRLPAFSRPRTATMRVTGA